MDEEQFLLMASQPCILGIDPGATNTGWVVLHEETGTVLHSSTVKRPSDMKPFTWAMLCVNRTDEEVSKFNITKVGVEGVEEPNIYHNGKKSVLRPLFLINTAVVAGAYASRWEKLSPVIVRPSKNGSRPKEEYPEELTGSRPKWLDGIPLPGIRNHERSSYDVAVKALLRYDEGYVYDQQEDMLRGAPDILNPRHSDEKSEKAKKKTLPAKQELRKGIKIPAHDLLSQVSKVK